MQMPSIENKWTTGNILTLVMLVVQILVFGASGVYYAGQQNVRTTALEAGSAEMRRDITATSSRLQASELNYGRLDERMISVQALLTSMDKKLETIQMQREP